MLALVAAQQIGSRPSRAAKFLTGRGRDPLLRDLLYQIARSGRSPNASILEPFCEPECISFRARIYQIWCAKYQGEARCLRMDWVSR